jgi:hypothetical protein
VRKSIQLWHPHGQDTHNLYFRFLTTGIDEFCLSETRKEDLI